MSFALTERQLVDGSKDVTRRIGWRDLKPGDQVVAVRKAMGLRKGERQVVLGTIRIVSVTFEPLSNVYCRDGDVRREGFPLMTPAEFVTFFCRANGGTAAREVTRIEFVFSPPEPAERKSDGN